MGIPPYGAPDEGLPTEHVPCVLLREVGLSWQGHPASSPGSRPGLDLRRRPCLRSDRNASIQRLLSATSYRPRIDLEHGLRMYVAWAQQADTRLK